MNKAQVKKALNAQFKKETVKYDNANGEERCLRDSNDKLVREIPTRVQYSPMDCTSVKSDKVDAKVSEVFRFLLSLGGKPKNTRTVEFEGARGKTFEAVIMVNKYRATYMYDEGYKNVYLDVVFLD